LYKLLVIYKGETGQSRLLGQIFQRFRMPRLAATQRDRRYNDVSGAILSRGAPRPNRLLLPSGLRRLAALAMM
jgi:hypothetical protein